VPLPRHIGILADIGQSVQRGRRRASTPRAHLRVTPAREARLTRGPGIVGCRRRRLRCRCRRHRGRSGRCRGRAGRGRRGRRGRGGGRWGGSRAGRSHRFPFLGVLLRRGRRRRRGGLCVNRVRCKMRDPAASPWRLRSHRYGLRLITVERQGHREVACSGHRELARRAALLPARGLRICTWRLGLDPQRLSLRPRFEEIPAWHRYGRTCSQR
jgi:hypothetical protein